MFKIALVSSLLIVITFTACSTKETIIVKKGSKYGVLDTSGKMIIKPKYEKISNFEDINNKNIKQEHANYLNFHWLHNYAGEEYAIIKHNGKYGIINKSNKVLVEPIYDYISKEYNGIFIIEKNKKFGYLNSNYKVVQNPIFSNVKEFISNIGFVQFSKNKKWGCITKDMQLKIDGIYDDIYNIKNGFARVQKNKKWGFINNNCEEVIPPKYDYVYDFSNGFAKVIKNKKITFINKKGEEIHKAEFEFAEKF